jgi:hypothetical protein
MRCLESFCNTTLVTSVRVLICDDRGNFSEVSKSLVRWRSAGGWKLEELFLVMKPNDGKHLDWHNFQTMLNETHFPLLHSVNIVQVGGQKVSLTELPWVVDSTTVSIHFLDVKQLLKITQHTYQPTTFKVSCCLHYETGLTF